MDYKEKYENALPYIEDLIAHNVISKEKASKYFPELRESEDEKIRKEIIGHCKDLIRQNKDDKVMISVYEPWVSWLEKQKYIKTAMEAWKEMRNEVFAQASGNRHEPNVSDEHSKIFSLSDINEIFEKISDSVVISNHAEWSEVDEKMIMSVIDKMKMTAPTMWEKEITWLESLRNHSIQKQGLSEEDEMFRYSIIRDLESLEKEAVVEQLKDIYNKEINWLKSLKHQPKHKWSEEYKKETKNKCPNYSEGYGCSISPLKQCDTCLDYKNCIIIGSRAMNKCLC